MTRSTLFLIAWTLLAGAGIPLIGPLNGGLARSVGNPLAATAVMFAIALLVALPLAVVIYGMPSMHQLGAAPATSYAAGLLIGFYALSATILIPRLGAGTFVTFILVAQLATAVVIDHFGLVGVPPRSVDLVRFGGLALIVGGIVLMQFAPSRQTAPTSTAAAVGRPHG